LNKQFTLRTHPAGAVVDARLTITTVGEETRIVFLFSRPVRHQPHAESLPNRVFWIDFHGVKLRSGLTVDLSHPVLKRVRVALFSDPDSIVRAAFTVAPGYRATVQPTGDAKQVVMVVKK
jgi:hypothetical protein